jgi:hypothetical protein
MLPNHIPWIMVGDFNIVKSMADQEGGNLDTVAESEKKAWQHLCHKVKGMDTFDEKINHLKLLQDNHGRMADNSTMSTIILRRVDRAYAPTQFREDRVEFKF